MLAQLRAHREADQLVKGTYWDDKHGCAVGCLTHDRAGGHKSYPERWGIPVGLAYLEDAIFEGLPHAEALRWPERFLGAIEPGADLSAVADRCAIRRLKRVLELAPRWPEAVRAQVVSAIRQVIAALEAGDERQRQSAMPARAAAMSMMSAAGLVVSAAARLVGSAESAAWTAEAEALIAELAAAPAAERSAQ